MREARQQLLHLGRRQVVWSVLDIFTAVARDSYSD